METPNFNSKITADEIKNHAKIILSNNNPIEAGFLNCRTANDCINDAKHQPKPKNLYFDLIIENELTILVADTGIG